MAKKKKTPTSSIPPADLAILAGRNAVTYTPQINQVRDLVRQSDEQYRSDIQAAKANAITAATAARNAIPQMRDIYGDARKDTDATHRTASAAVQGVGPAADVFSSAQAREQGAARDRLTSARSGALSELQNRIVGAESGRQLAITQARKERGKTRDVLSQKLADILQEQGATSTAALAEMQAGRDAATSKANEKAATQKAKDDAAAQKTKDAATLKRQEHIKQVHTATGDYQNKIADAQADWDTFSRKKAPRTETVMENGKPKIDSKTGQVVTRTVVDGKGNVVYDYPTPDELRGMLANVRDANGHIKYTPGDIHIALLVGNGPHHPGKPLDAAALAYLKKLAGHGVRIPRAWTQAAYGGNGTAPPSGRPVGGTPNA
jgi:hypothetical protein